MSIVIFTSVLIPVITANAETLPIANFYIDEDHETPYYQLTASEDWKIPSVIPEKSGYTFKGWTDGGMSVYKAGASVAALTEDKEFYALWQENVAPIESLPVFTDMEKIWLTLGLAILLALIAFVYYWFIIKKKSFKDFFKSSKN
jgi:uncharacterized repeat protein (TIGR02543 family)